MQLRSLVALCALAVSQVSAAQKQPSVFWYEQIKHQGTSSYNNDTTYQVYRNVKDFGAKGDGVTDDTAAINAAFAQGDRCADDSCGGSSTLTPASVYFPAGDYAVSSGLLPLYMTQMIGNPLNPPTLKALNNFTGPWVIDGDQYLANGRVYGSTNNFYKTIQNFIIDLTELPSNAATYGIHWSVAQATTIQNVVVNMAPGASSMGMLIEDGSGGFMSDLTFNGGSIGMNVGNQQFTSRNIKFNGCATAINQQWDWAWTYSGLSVNNCQVGINLAVTPGANQSVGSLMVLDSTFSNTPIAIKTSTTNSTLPPTSGTMYIENVQFLSVESAIADFEGNQLLAGNRHVAAWGQGHLYEGSSNQFKFVQQAFPNPHRSQELLDGNGNYLAISMPQFQQYSASQFASVKSGGAKGDGKTDDTAAIQRVINENAGRKIIYFDAGSYIVSGTIHVPGNTLIVGEAWATIMATGPTFGNVKRTAPVFQVGNPWGEWGTVQIVGLIFSNAGPIPGAVLIEWNINDPTRQSGLWNVHGRMGGAAGSNQLDNCIATSSPFTPDPACFGCFLMLHVTRVGSIYAENTWWWTADHNLDGNHEQVSIFSGRGVLIESVVGANIFRGTAAEHNIFYQYQVSGARNVGLFMIQTETPYFQSNPPAPVPYTPVSSISDPTFSNCNGNGECAKAWAARIINSDNVWVYGAGLYSFFDNYGQTCIPTGTCQRSIYEIDSSSNVYTFNLNTIASESMVDDNGKVVVSEGPNANVFPWTIVAYFLNTARNGYGQGSRPIVEGGRYGFGIPGWICQLTGYAFCHTS